MGSVYTGDANPEEHTQGDGKYKVEDENGPGERRMGSRN